MNEYASGVFISVAGFKFCYQIVIIVFFNTNNLIDHDNQKLDRRS
jgi:hypothetical protein